MPQKYSFDLNGALKAGYSPVQVQQYLNAQQKQGNQYQLTDTPQATPQQSQQPAPKSNGFADLLPTIGSVVGGVAGAAIPVLGETGLGEVGGAAAGAGLGETAKELIEGKPLSAGDIAGQTAVGGIGGALGKGVGYVAGKVLPKVGQAVAEAGARTIDKAGELAGKVTPKVFDPVIPDDMNYADSMANLATTAKTYGLMDGKPIEMLPKVKQTAQLIDAHLHSLPEMQGSFDVNAAQQDFMKQLADSNISPSDPRYAPSIQSFSNKILNLGKSAIDVNTPQILGADGQPVTSPGSATLANAYGLKAATANDDLQRVFNKLKNPAGSDLTPEERVQYALWNSLKNSMDTQGTPQIRQLNSLQNNLFTIGRAYAKAAGKNAPSGGFSMKDLFPLGAGDIAGSALGIGGLPGAAAAVALNHAATNPAILGAVGKGVQGAGQVLQKGINPALGSIASQTVGQGIARNLLPSSPGVLNNTNSENNGANNIQNNQNTQLPSTPSQAFGSNSSTNNSTIQGANPLQGYTINGKPIDPATANLIQKVATYQIDPTKISSLKNEDRQRLVSLVSQYDPTYDSSQFPVKQKLRDDFTSGKTSINIKTMNTAIAHLSALSQASTRLGNGSFTPFNAVKNNISQMTGNPQVTNFNQISGQVAAELASVYKSSGATDSEIEQMQKGINSSESPQQLQGNINSAITLLGGKLNAIQNQYIQGMKTMPDFEILSPETQQILQALQASSDPNALPASPQ